MRRAVSVLAAVAAAVLLAPAALAEAAPEAPCGAGEHRQFDFWVGTWDVRDPSGTVVGSNVIRPILGGCVLLEEWTSARGGAGKSFNAWDRTRRLWHQTWVDGRGLVLLLDGGLRDGAMVLEGGGAGADGKPVRNRITWTPLEDGRVRQHWETSPDGGATWTTAFDGTYARVAPETPVSAAEPTTGAGGS